MVMVVNLMMVNLIFLLSSVLYYAILGHSFLFSKAKRSVVFGPTITSSKPFPSSTTFSTSSDLGEVDVAGSADGASVRANVDRVSICMGELCKCQEEGNNAESIMIDLQSRNLSFDVEDAPCLGACGLGAMVSVEYDDGDYRLVTGLDETLEAIGLAPQNDFIRNEVFEENASQMNNLNISTDSTIVGQEGQTATMEIITSDVLTQSLSEYTSDAQDMHEAMESTREEVEVEHDAIKRMRAEATPESNPWINMAMYIGGKFKDGIIK